MKHFPLNFRLRLLGLLVLMMGSPLARAQAPAWQTAVASSQQPTNGNGCQVQAMAADASGGVFLAGSFQGTVSFGSTSLTSAGSSDVFLAKWSNASGAFVWAQRAGGAGYDYGEAIAINGASVYVAGFFSGPSANFGNTSFTPIGSSDAFVAKLTDAGQSSTYVWAKQAGGTAGAVDITAMAVTGANVYLTGLFTGAGATFDSTLLTAVGATDVFVAKLADLGSSSSFVWAQRAGGTDGDDARAIAVNGANVYVAGSFSGPAASFGSITLTNAGSSDIYVAKLTDAGPSASFAWARRAGGNDNERAAALAVSGTQVYVAGSFVSATITFGSITLTNAGSSDIYVAKLTDAGPSASFAWAQRAGGNGSDGAQAVVVSGANVYLVGSYVGPTADFGSTTLVNNSTRNRDIVVAKLLDAGSTSSFAWAQRAGGNGEDRANAASVSGTNVYVGGSVTPPANFSSLLLAGPVNSQLGFLAALTDNAVLATGVPGALPGLGLTPNPAHGTATVQLPPVPGAPTATLTLLDALGRAVRTRTVPLPAAGLRYELDLAGLAPGLYALRVAAGGGTATRRLVVE